MELDIINLILILILTGFMIFLFIRKQPSNGGGTSGDSVKLGNEYHIVYDDGKFKFTN